jgi:dolichol-phosphate mannosyltransferase
MLLSIVMPARNEAGSLPATLRELHGFLVAANVPHEIVVVNDGSHDDTEAVLAGLSAEIPVLRPIRNDPPHGFGLAVRAGFKAARGEAVAVVMADASDAPEDVVAFYRKLLEGYDCAFGSRFLPGSRVTGYPLFKKTINRAANSGIRLLFGIRYNDTTNAFKMYRAHVLEGLNPLLSHHFNLTVELPLKAIIRGYSYAVLPNAWRGRSHGESKLKLREMGSRYLFIVLYCLIEKWLCAQDYRRGPPDSTPTPR